MAAMLQWLFSNRMLLSVMESKCNIGRIKRTEISGVQVLLALLAASSNVSAKCSQIKYGIDGGIFLSVALDAC
jgi:hypothetical protein